MNCIHCPGHIRKTDIEDTVFRITPYGVVGHIICPHCGEGFPIRQTTTYEPVVQRREDDSLLKQAGN